MTKHVRIENADTSQYKVIVEVVDVAADGTETISKVTELNYPTQLTTETIYSTRYIRIRENGVNSLGD